MPTVELTATADRDVLVVGPPDITQAVESAAQAFRDLGQALRDLGQAAREAGEALGITYNSRPSPKSRRKRAHRAARRRRINRRGYA